MTKEEWYSIYMQKIVMEEIRKDIPWYDGSYQASNLWNIRSTLRQANYNWKFWSTSRTIKWKVLSKIHKDWYYYVNIRYKNKSIKRSVHSLVAITFIGQRQLWNDINHIDWDKSNNSLLNLEYCSRSDNMKHALRMWLVNYKSWPEHKQSKKIKIFWNWIDKVVYWTKEASLIT